MGRLERKIKEQRLSFVMVLDYFHGPFHVLKLKIYLIYYVSYYGTKGIFFFACGQFGFIIANDIPLSNNYILWRNDISWLNYISWSNYMSWSNTYHGVITYLGEITYHGVITYRRVITYH